MDDFDDFDGIAGVVLLVLSVAFTISVTMEKWAPLLWTGGVMIGIVVLLFVGIGLEALINYVKRGRRSRRYDAQKRAEETQMAIEALVQRALEQHVTYQLGIINNVPDMVRDGVFGKYYPHKLDWPVEVEA